MALLLKRNPAPWRAQQHPPGTGRVPRQLRPYSDRIVLDARVSTHSCITEQACRRGVKPGESRARSCIIGNSIHQKKTGWSSVDR